MSVRGPSLSTSSQLDGIRLSPSPAVYRSAPSHSAAAPSALLSGGRGVGSTPPRTCHWPLCQPPFAPPTPPPPPPSSPCLLPGCAGVPELLRLLPGHQKRSARLCCAALQSGARCTRSVAMAAAMEQSMPGPVPRSCRGISSSGGGSSSSSLSLPSQVPQLACCPAPPTAPRCTSRCAAAPSPSWAQRSTTSERGLGAALCCWLSVLIADELTFDSTCSCGIIAGLDTEKHPASRRFASAPAHPEQCNHQQLAWVFDCPAACCAPWTLWSCPAALA